MLLTCLGMKDPTIAGGCHCDACIGGMHDGDVPVEDDLVLLQPAQEQLRGHSPYHDVLPAAVAVYGRACLNIGQTVTMRP